ncbi:hypothetical protein ACROYT_G018487 [Oculina patagonica]
MQNYMYQLPHVASSRHITEEKLCQIVETFHNADEGKKGHLTNEDLKVAFVALFGYKPSKNEVEQLMAKTQTQQTVSLASSRLPSSQPLTKKSEDSRTEQNPDATYVGMSLEHFTEIAKAKILAEDSDDEIRQMFIAFDVMCRGFITLDIAKRVFQQVAPFLDSVTVEKLFREADMDRDGRVSYRDFEFIMKYRLDD